MEFRTEYKSRSARTPVQLDHALLTAGSCFAQSIGQKLRENKFNASVNPFGTVYHPVAIHRNLQTAIGPCIPDADGFVARDEAMFHYDFHSSHSYSDRPGLLQQLSNLLTSAGVSLRKAQWIMLTYGTAWLYERKDNGKSVANCHKQPGHLFTRRLSRVEEIVSSFQELHAAMTAVNPGLHFILTVSPVRHLRDGIPANNASKSVLRVACEEIKNQLDRVDYFPAFEIMMDDLRDYRFYKTDLIHPSEQAEDYIWEKFTDAYFDEDLRKLLLKWSDIRRHLAHRPFEATSKAHQHFLRQTLTQLESLRTQLNVEEEIKRIQSQII